MKSNAEEEVERLQRYLDRIAELADRMENSNHDAAVAHLIAISRLVREAR